MMKKDINREKIRKYISAGLLATVLATESVLIMNETSVNDNKKEPYISGSEDYAAKYRQSGDSVFYADLIKLIEHDGNSIYFVPKGYVWNGYAFKVVDDNYYCIKPEPQVTSDGDVFYSIPSDYMINGKAVKYVHNSDSLWIYDKYGIVTDIIVKKRVINN